MVRIDIDSDSVFRRVMQSPKVRAKVNERAARISAAARRDLNRAGVSAAVEIREHPLASGRYGLDVVAYPKQEDRRAVARVIRRAGRSVRR